jgi:hypothetical protein
LDVTVKADTIYISQPISIHYRLTLVGRVVAITQPISMTMTSALLFESPTIESWTYSEKQIHLDDQISMRERRFGLVDILDENVERSFDQSSCQPAVIPAALENVRHLQ